MKKILIIALIVIVLLGGAGYGALRYIDSKIYVKPSPEAKIPPKTVNDQQVSKVPTDNGTGVENILLTGLDARNKDADSRTDSIIMLTIDKANKEIKLTSFMRDMYVKIPGYKESKINAAYFLGGPELLIQTLNENFNTNIQYYATIDFKAFQDLVDKFGGVDINVKPYEIKEMNKYIKEENWSDPEYVYHSGMQHLNGKQVLAYCRIRKVGNNDYERTERQRRVLSLLIDKAKTTNLLKLPELASSILPYVKTNMPSTELLKLGYDAYRYDKTPVATLRIPYDGMFTSGRINGQSVLLPDFEKNTTLLEKFIASGDTSQLLVSSTAHTGSAGKKRTTRKHIVKPVANVVGGEKLSVNDQTTNGSAGEQ